MSRVAKVPVLIPRDVEVYLDDKLVLTVKGPNGLLRETIPSEIKILRKEGAVFVIGDGVKASAILGTVRALLSNMVVGVSQGFKKELELIGVGYRAQIKDENLNLVVGYSHPVNFPVPEGIVIEIPTNTRIIVRGIDKQKVGQTAASIRSFRPPDPYKGKGIRYIDEIVIRKVAKKK
uniref:Large ribosomal subunit protein uL6 n=1 Tax=Candidatus Kentrum sp. MB TaxID=2138164 RepID=A0A450XH65_9GAMM|nr:MAG: large subunit ribosomal protein L6 [Candidatus Kentron sp. MB]VFK32241.1 MAG: large subunit ribosomal protein L6 [Candidatus Kentron sp. MB]VFK75768.1 MAG: large subunit ribosomal protein L6 [Candidatus Kentron sp. MB]